MERCGDGLPWISIHAPREGSDDLYIILGLMCSKFQSTLPVRGATEGRYTVDPAYASFQSTLPVRGATALLNYAGANSIISIHAPREGSDCTFPHLVV